MRGQDGQWQEHICDDACGQCGGAIGVFHCLVIFSSLGWCRACLTRRATCTFQMVWRCDDSSRRQGGLPNCTVTLQSVDGGWCSRWVKSPADPWQFAMNGPWVWLVSFPMNLSEIRFGSSSLVEGFSHGHWRLSENCR